LLGEIVAAGSLRGLTGFPDEAQRLFVTANEVSPDQRLTIQKAFQRHVDNAVSTTINLPVESSREEVAQAYLNAWRLGLTHTR